MILLRTRIATAAGLLLLVLLGLPMTAASAAGASTAPSAAPASAAAVVGGLVITPVTGSDLTPFNMTTTKACPTGTHARATVYGSGFPSDGQNVAPNLAMKVYTHTAGGGIIVPLSSTLKDFASSQDDPKPLTGTYRLAVICLGPASVDSLGEFDGSMTFTTPHAYVAKQPTISAASLSPVPQAPAQPSAVGSQAPEVTKNQTPTVHLKATGAASGGNRLSGWVIGGGALLVAFGVMVAVRARRTGGAPRGA